MARSNAEREAYANSTYTPPAIPTFTPTPIPDQKKLADALPSIQDGERDFNIVVFGDSTGVSGTGWQVLVPTWLGEKYDRPVTLHPWNRDDLKYDQLWGLRQSGKNAPITVWNGSSPGRNVAFAREHQKEIVPVDADSIDLVFVNFGHTEKLGLATDTVGSFMEDLAKEYPNAPIVYLKQNPDRSESPLIETQAANVEALEQWTAEHKFESIPVYDAFIKAGNVDSLIDGPTLIHPNEKGYKIWSKVMIKRLKDDGF